MEILLTVIIILVIYIAFREYLFYQTVLDLTAKIKAGSLEEYVYSKKTLESKDEIKVPDAAPVDIENADPEKYLKALQNDLEKEKSEKDLEEE